jgi:glycosyltransferase involved in cell wall biosynthesis
MTVTQLFAPAAPAVAAPAERPSLFDATQLWAPADPAIELTVVIPFYNPGPALRHTVRALAECLDSAGIGYEIIAVSDGSTDGSEHTVTDIAHTRVITNPHNQGKGAALHRGFAAARGAWIGFIDADGDINPRHLLDYLHQARAGQHAGVYADKRHQDSGSHATGLRKTISRTYSTLVTSLFRLGIRDSQTGCKVFRRDVLAELLPRLCERRFAFDLELFVAAKTAGITDFAAAPVQLEIRVNGSTVTSKAILRTVRDTFVIYGRRHFTDQYRTGTPPIAIRRPAAAPVSQWHATELLADAA